MPANNHGRRPQPNRIRKAKLDRYEEALFELKRLIAEYHVKAFVTDDAKNVFTDIIDKALED